MTERILLWHWGRRGGGPRYTLELARALAARGDAEVHLSWSRQSELADATAGLGLPSFPVDTYNGLFSAARATLRLPLLRRRFARYIADHGIGTVFCTMNHLWNAAVVPALRPAGARYVLALHDALPHPGEDTPWRRWTLMRDLAATDGVIALSEHVRGQLVGVHGYDRARTWVLPHGVFSFGPAEPRRLRPGQPVRLCFFGRILAYKGVDILLDAYARLRRRYGAGVELLVAGSGPLEPYASALAGLEGVRVDNRWIAEEEIPRVLEPADLLILPYREASQSGVVPTACGMGLPVVVTPVGGLVEQVEEGRTGRIAAAVTAEAVAAAAAALIDDPEGYARCSQGALAFARDRLSWEAIAAGYLDVAAAVRGAGSR
ncbi:glycosyltransferase family 4 protein [Azospirillum sp. TSO22-1]|uniref:glycosyltransferase family 4 protein n=1 Tax=Azospirillum sp. TSO22-1 TaxID=716789 RepID=UPI000D64D9FF|nr:glycosyltransferase family 4 protein [Azospirillum sp. TSO22-1]